MVEHTWFKRYEKTLLHRLYFGFGLQKQDGFDTEDLWHLQYEHDYILTDTFEFLWGLSYDLKNYDGENTDVLGLYFMSRKNF